MTTIEELSALLNLQPHPEGGYFAETYRAPEAIATEALPDRYTMPHVHGTAIYYLLTAETFSALHRLRSDEIFHFYLGDPVEMLQFHPEGKGERILLGAEISAEIRPQVVVPQGVWQGARLVPGGEFALLGCTVAPGFEYVDFEIGDRASLLEAYPDFRDEILALTH